MSAPIEWPTIVGCRQIKRAQHADRVIHQHVRRHTIAESAGKAVSAEIRHHDIVVSLERFGRAQPGQSIHLNAVQQQHRRFLASCSGIVDARAVAGFD
jgi:hypothetical protein